LLSVPRTVAALMFLPSGTMKLVALPAGMPPNGGTAPLLSQLGASATLEAVGGALLLVGLFTRPVAFFSRARWRLPVFSSFRESPVGGRDKS
jgi:putative oxidoreductase